MAFLKRTWAEINLDNLAFNVNEIKNRLPNSTKMLAVVKANAYGHGDKLVANELQNMGIDFFGVSNLEEAISLRHAEIKGEILVLGSTPESVANDIKDFEITQTVYSPEYAKKLNESAKACNVIINCHMKLDTGMGRIGFDCDDINEIVKAYNYQNLNFTGIFSHLSSADDLTKEGTEYTKAQAEKFDKTISLLEKTGVTFKLRHLQNSAGILNYPHFKYDLARAGLILYGNEINTFKEYDITLKPVMELRSVVSMVKNVKKGDAISYSRKFTADKDMRLATVPIGYADGYLRAFSNSAKMIVNGHFAKVVGNICMDQLVLDVTDIPDVNEGDIITVVGKEGECEITFKDLANLANTINYELICLIGRRVPRVYIKDNKITEAIDYII